MVLKNQPLFKPGQFFAPQKLRQQLQFAAPILTNNTAQESSRAKAQNEKAT